MSLHILGIRHHGPGSSRHVIEALHALKPDIILIEGPPEGEEMLQWTIHEDMKPPVALLAYVPDHPQQAVFYPFTSFSPEWNAILYGTKQEIPVRFIDMPLIHKLAMQSPAAEEETTAPVIETEETVPVPDDETVLQSIRRNPISYLSEIAGFEDAEEWWEHRFELAHQPAEVFDAISESMTSLREHVPGHHDETEKIREAFMRKAIRTAQKEMYSTIVVICGAWHVPALTTMPTQKEDDALIKGLPKTKVATTWIPWTSDRLSYTSGYGAGVESPGWYRHYWQHPTDDGSKWLSHVARVFRNHKVDVSSAHIIEAVRLSNALAGLRNLGRPGLKEFNEATTTVMCMGDEVLMKLVWEDLIVGKDMGQVPEGTPQVPLQKNMEQLIKKFRMKVSHEEVLLKLDLREDNDLQKSILLHRLRLLDIDWGKIRTTSGKGTFKEEWGLRWYPELTIALLEKAPWGNTVEFAANKYTEDLAQNCRQLSDITKLVQKALPAELHSGIRTAMKRMDELAAGTSDTSVLMDAFIPLVQVSRYGNVRNTDLETIDLILKAVFYRITAALPMSCTGINEEQAAEMLDKINAVNQSVQLLDEAALKDAWQETAVKIISVEQAAPVIRGFCTKMLYDAKYIDSDTAANEFSKALSVNNDPSFSANWLEGFLKDAATVLILDDAIWNIVNQWVASLEEEIFSQIIPLLRRTFSIYSNVEKTKIAEKVKHGKTTAIGGKKAMDIDTERAAMVLPVLETLMGLSK